MGEEETRLIEGADKEAQRLDKKSKWNGQPPLTVSVCERETVIDTYKCVCVNI